MTSERRSHLKVGLDVPWVTSWSAEPLTGVGPCVTVGGRLALGQAEQPGYGKPQYSMNHLRRQRDSVRRMLCPMCGRPTTADDRWTQTATRTTAGALRAEGPGRLLPAQVPDAARIVDAGSVAPLHEACARWSLEQCPFLRGHAAVDLRRFPTRWTAAPLLVEAQARAHALIAAPAVTVAVAFLQLFGIE